MIKKQQLFQTNSCAHNINTRNEHQLRKTNANTSFIFKKNTFYAAIKIFSMLPPSVTTLKNDKAKFKAALRKYLNTHSFDAVGGYFMSTDDL
jgi:hypothetical protein